jgi:hypothetical protein
MLEIISLRFLTAEMEAAEAWYSGIVFDDS